MQFSDEFMEKWEYIIKDVDATEIPIECIKKVVIKLSNRRQRTINVTSLKRQGLAFDEIEMVLARHLSDYDAEIRDIDFILDVAAVAEIVQPETDNLLKNL